MIVQCYDAIYGKPKENGWIDLTKVYHFQPYTKYHDDGRGETELIVLDNSHHHTIKKEDFELYLKHRSSFFVAPIFESVPMWGGIGGER